MPKKPQAIDLACYKKVAPVAGLFHKQFWELKVPYPINTALAKIDQQFK
jgi:hypothetical protein